MRLFYGTHDGSWAFNAFFYGRGCKSRSNLSQRSHLASTEAAKIYSHEESEASWRSYLSRPQPGLEATRGYFLDAAEEFGVPAELLMAIGQVESNWTQMGPSIDGGWGIMHLVDSPSNNALDNAAALLHVDREVLKDSAKDNIRGAAALLAETAGPARKTFKKIDDWFPAAMAFSGLGDAKLEFMQAQRYFEVIRNGVNSHTYFGTSVYFKGNKNVIVPIRDEAFIDEAAPDYPPGIDELTTCNFTKGRAVKIDIYTNHWIGYGTYAGAIALFKQCNRDNPSAANFVVGADGRVAQTVSVNDTAWHAGVNSPVTNNSRSIGVEHEVTLAKPDDWNNDVLLKASTNLARFMTAKYHIPHVHIADNKDLKNPGIRGHKEMPNASTQCPGPLPWDKWLTMLDAKGDDPAPDTKQIPPPPPPPPPPSPNPDQKNPTSNPTTSFEVRGIIYEGSDSSVRIADATVTLSTGATTKSDATGVYQFTGVAGGDYTIKVTKDGYQEKSRSIKVSISPTWVSVSLSK